MFVDYNERNDLLEPVSPKAKQVPIRRETVRSLMDSMGKSFKCIQLKMFERMVVLIEGLLFTLKANYQKTSANVKYR